MHILKTQRAVNASIGLHCAVFWVWVKVVILQIICMVFTTDWTYWRPCSLHQQRFLINAYKHFKSYFHKNAYTSAFKTLSFYSILHLSTGYKLADSTPRTSPSTCTITDRPHTQTKRIQARQATATGVWLVQGWAIFDILKHLEISGIKAHLPGCSEIAQNALASGLRSAT